MQRRYGLFGTIAKGKINNNRQRNNKQNGKITAEYPKI